jgi:WD40 repeat protein
MNPVHFKPAAEFAHEAPLMSCAFDAGGRFIFAGGRDRSVLAINLDSAKKSLLLGHNSWVGTMARAGDVVLTADFAGRVIAWDSGGQEPKPRWTIDAHPCTIYGLSVSVDGKTFATGDRDGLVRIWRTDDGKMVHELPRIEFPVYGVALHPDGRRIATADRQPQKPRVQVWDIASGKQLLSIDAAELSGYRRVEDIEWGGIRALALSPNGTQLIACGRNGYDGQACAMLYETDGGKLQQKLAISLKGGFYYSAKFHPQGFLMTAGGDIAKGELRCWDLSQNESIASVAGTGPCLGLDVHPDGSGVAVAQAVGKKSAPESGLLSIYELSK